MRKLFTAIGVASLYVALAGVTFVVTRAAIRPAVASPPAGMASDCSPDSIWGTYTASGFSTTGTIHGPFNGWAYAYTVSGAWSFTCPPASVSYASSCRPCYSIRLFKNTGWPNNPEAWVDLQKPESYFQIQNSPIGACGTGGSFNTTFTMNELARGDYEVQITFGAGDDRRCYTLATFARRFVIP